MRKPKQLKTLKKRCIACFVKRALLIGLATQTDEHFLKTEGAET
jgi:hypothetical protein